MLFGVVQSRANHNIHFIITKVETQQNFTDLLMLILVIPALRNVSCNDLSL